MECGGEHRIFVRARQRKDAQQLYEPFMDTVLPYELPNGIQKEFSDAECQEYDDGD